MKRINDFLNSVPMLIVSSVFLAISLIEHIGLLSNYEFPVDPAWVSIIISGFPLAYLAIERVVKQFYISSALLITIAMIACIYIGEIFAAGEVAFIMAIGAWLEDRTVERTKKGIEALLKLVPSKGRRIASLSDGTVKEEMVEAKDLKVGDIIRVLPGETIAADGKITYGQTSVDQSIMTGESLPVDKVTGDSVFTGTINRFGSVDIKITKAFEYSSLQKMIQLVKEAENNKAPMQRIVDKWATWLVPIACIIAVITFMVTDDIVRAVTVLVVFCPCALALATPTSIVAAIGQATKFGVLIKSGEALERMGSINTIVFDKTGTLTHGNLVISDIVAFDTDEDELILLAASTESRSEHPLGKAIVSYARSKESALKETDNFVMTIGKGVAASVNGRRIFCGNEKFVQEEKNITISESVKSTITALRDQGKAVIIVSDETAVLGILALSDTLKEESRHVIAKLAENGIKRTILLTGDNEQTALHIAKQVGITEVRSSLLPEGKVEVVTLLQENGQHICMVGDGVNDAPALKSASVGIAMGTMGSDIAIEAADIALMGDDISKINYIKRLSNATVKTIKFNIAASMLINFAAIVFSVLGWLTPVTGALVHNAGSVLVVLNAALLYDRKYDDRSNKHFGGSRENNNPTIIKPYDHT
jgi:heavy metal translocating P-type ATPase